jgi:hypothetical protein
MAKSVGSFRPNDPVTQGELADLVAALTEEPPRSVADPSAPVTMAQLDARLVRVLDLSDDAALFYAAASGAGLRPPTRFGTEVVARLLGLRTNHPAGQDPLERLPNDPATRAEAAYSVARLLSVSESEKTQIEDEAATFALPVLTAWQQRVLTTAVKFIGYPYVGAASTSGRNRRTAPSHRAGSIVRASRGASTRCRRIRPPLSWPASCAAAPPRRWPGRCLAV